MEIQFQASSTLDRNLPVGQNLPWHSAICAFHLASAFCLSMSRTLSCSVQERGCRQSHSLPPSIQHTHTHTQTATNTPCKKNKYPGQKCLFSRPSLLGRISIWPLGLCSLCRRLSIPYPKRWIMTSGYFSSSAGAAEDWQLYMSTSSWWIYWHVLRVD